MSVPKFQGVETEYGISISGQDMSAILGLSEAHDQRDRVDADSPSGPIWGTCGKLIEAYVAGKPSLRDWDFEAETPARDARDDGADRRPGGNFAIIPLLNTVLTNGARYYVDHAHPEYSGPEVSNARDLVVYDKAGDRILEASMAALRRASGYDVLVYKNNSDGKGNSYACHENYLVGRQGSFSGLARKLIPFFVTRQIFTGSGKVGAENGAEPTDYQISQRADFIEAEVGLETTFRRPIINSRDEPHADPERYRRLHVIVGDSNMAETSIYLRNGVTALMLSMIEDGFITNDFSLANPVGAIKQVSRDLTCRRPIELADGRTITALDLQMEYLSLAKKYAAKEGVDEVTADVLERFEEVLKKLERDPMNLANRLDWVAKLRVLQGYQERRGWSPSDARNKLVDLQYHDVRRDKGLYYRLEQGGRIGRIVSDAEIDYAVDHPPEDSRAYFRGECVRRYAGQIAFASWDTLLFDLQDGAKMHKVRMLNPDQGTKAQVGGLLDSSIDAAALVSNLAAA